MIEEIYKILKACDETRTVYEITEIMNDLSTIDNILNHGDIIAITEVYKQMRKKYNEKLDIIGFQIYQSLANMFTFYNHNINNTNLINIEARLKRLRSWIIEYGAYKVLETRGKEYLEKCTLRYYQYEINNGDAIDKAMNDIDSRLLEQLKQ